MVIEKINCKYISFPVSDQSPLTRMKLSCAHKSWLFDVQLVSPDQADYWVFYDLRFLSGAALTLTSFSGIDEAEWTGYIRLDNTIPGGASVYHEAHRPKYHFTSPRGWINDPNGLIKQGSDFHMFYQLNPFGCRGFDKGWGHCVSQNLFDWEILPPALSADESGYAISGSALFDCGNRSGFGNNSWILAYSSRYHMAPERGQMQNIAYSDDGQIFTKYSGNPVITDFSGPDFRDPKVFWYEKSSAFIMLVTFGSELRFYSSPDLKDWTLISVADDSLFNPGKEIYECPDLFEMTDPGTGETIWVLSVSIIQDRSVRFIFGTFDGKTFIKNPEYPIQKADYGKDFYAAISWNMNSSAKNRRLWISWLCYWPYSGQLPKDEGWVNMFTVPRDMFLCMHNGLPEIRQQPAKELFGLVVSEEEFSSIHSSSSISFPDAFLLSGILSGNGCGTITIEYASGEQVRLFIDKDQHILQADRSLCNYYHISDPYPEMLEMPIEDDKSGFLILGDRNCLELFFDDGRHCMSLLCHAEKHTGTICINSSQNFTVEDLTLSEIRNARFSF